MKIANLYCGEGGNRELWGDEHEITAVEIDPKIAEKYQNTYQNDTVIVGDAHEWLLDNHKYFDFVWSSPPCPKHSRTNHFTQHIAKRNSYPDMKLWQEIIFLKHFYKGLFCVENVIPYYDPFLPNYTQIGRHLLWSNFNIPKIPMPKNEIGSMDKGWNTACKKPIGERNKVNSELGMHVLNCALGIYKDRAFEVGSLFCS